MKSRRSKACDISQKVKEAAWERDGHRCIYCGSPYAMPNAHYIPRSKGGMGIQENIVSLCILCHMNYDQTNKRNEYKEYIKKYLKSKYIDWDEEKIYYNGK